MLNAQIISLKRQGKENVNHKPAIEHEDLTKLKTSQAIAFYQPFFLASKCVVSCYPVFLSERKRRPEATQKVKFQI